MAIKLIIGLGNPDKKYTLTYHNVGFLFIDYLEKNLMASQSLITNYQLLKSGVYMNDSGRFVAKELRKNGVKPEELLVIHDDSDIELGKFKVSFGRGSAGHKGVLSIINALKTRDFRRLRIGVRKARGGLAGRSSNEALLRQGLRRTQAGDFVLKKIAKADLIVLQEVFKEALAKILESST